MSLTMRVAKTPGELVVLPSPLEVHVEGSDGDLALEIELGAQTQTLYMRPPQGAFVDRPLVNTEAGDVPCLSLYWDSLEASQEEPSVCLVQRHCRVTIPFGGFSCDHNSVAGGCKRQNAPRVVVNLPYLTNDRALRPGDRIFHRPG